MPIHFEELWNKCETLQEDAAKHDTTQSIIDELVLKLNLYKAIDSKTEIDSQEREKVKSRTMGEILLTLTKLSMKDNINVYEALNIAMQYRSIGHYQQKYGT